MKNTDFEAMAKRLESFVADDQTVAEVRSRADEAQAEKRKTERLYNIGFEKREIAAINSLEKPIPWLTKKNNIVDLFVDGNGIAFLIGSCGTGKTAMACFIANELMSEYGKSVTYVKAIRFFMGLKQCWRRDAVKTETEYLAAFEKPDVLIIDEIQDRSAGDWENSILTDLIDQRYRACKSTLILSNLAYEKIKETTPESIWSRAEQNGTFVQLNNHSYRSQTTQQHHAKPE